MRRLRTVILTLLLLTLTLAISTLVTAQEQTFSLVSSTPDDGAALGLNQPVELTFSAPIDCATAIEGVRLPANADATTECFNNQLTLRPVDGWPLGTLSITVTTALQSSSGSRLPQDLTLSFAVVDSLRVSEVLPALNVTDVNPNAVVTVIFDRPVIPLTIAQDTEAFPSPIRIEPAVPGEGEWLNTFIYTFTPAEDSGWLPGNRYDITVDAGLEAADGTTLQAPFTWNFFAEAPMATTLRPTPDSEAVRLDIALGVGFNLAFDRQVIEEAFTLEQVDGSTVPVTFEYLDEDDDGVSRLAFFRIQPDEMLAPATRYFARLDADLIFERSGVSFSSDIVWSFRTLPLPNLIATSPPNGGTTRSTSGFTLDFNTLMDEDSITERITIEPEPDYFSGYTSGYTYYGTFNGDGSTTYTITVEAGIKDIFGNVYDETIRFTYDTLPLSPTYYLNVPGGDTGFYNANNPDTGFYVHHRNVERLGVSLYNITPEEFVRRLLASGSSATLYDIEPEASDLVRAWSVDLDNPLDTYVPTLLTLGADANCLSDTRFNVGDVVTIAADDALPALLEPGDSNEAFYIFPQIEVPIVSGPACILPTVDATEDVVWWQVDVGGDRGWIRAEDLVYVDTSRVTGIPLTEDRDPLDAGFYLIEVDMLDPVLRRDDNFARRTTMSVMTATLTMKVSYDDLTVWATDVQTGEPIPNAPITVYDGSGVIATGFTDADGLLVIRVPIVDENRLAQRAALLHTDEHLGIGMTDWRYGLEPFSFGIDGSSSTSKYSGVIYTDRDIYRPGETVYFRGVIRERDDMTYTVPSLLDRVTISFSDGENQISREVELTPFGTYSGEIELSPDADLSSFYDVRANFYVPDQPRPVFTSSGSFSVAEFRLPEYEVFATAARDDIAAGEDAQAVINGEYFFGGPVSQADVTYSVFARPYRFTYTGEGRYSFTDWWSDPDRDSFREREIAFGEGRTDDDGNFIVSFAADLGEFGGSQTFQVEATLRDEANNTVSARTSIDVHAGDFYIGTRPRSYVSRTDEAATVDLIAVDWDSVGVADLTLDVQVVQREWFSVQTRDPISGRTEWTYEYEDIPVEEGSVVTDAEGKAVYSFTPTAGGQHILLLTGRDERGNTITGSALLYVSSSSYVSWRVDNTNRIDLYADQDDYRVGDVAEILIASPFQGEATALITVERAGIITSDVVTLDSNSFIYELPIEEDFAPNVFVSVFIVKGVDENNPVADYRMGLIMLPVDIEQKRVTIEIETDATEFQPNDTVSYTVRTLDYAGQPIQAEVGVALTDRAALTVSMPPSLSPDWMLNRFYNRQGLAVRTSTPLVINTDQITAAVQETIKGGGGGGGGGPLVVDVREDFVSTPYWDATVVTDPQTGEATFDLTLPDNLTTWQLNAFAITDGADAPTRFGQRDYRIISTLPLLIRPVTPRFFVVDDKVLLAAVVNNNSGAEQTVVVTLEAAGVTVEGNLTQTVVVPDGGRGRVEWLVTAQDVEAAEMIFYAASEDGSFTDASRPPLGQGDDRLIPIYRYEAPETVGTAGTLFVDDAERQESVVLPEEMNIVEGDLTVNVSSSLAGPTLDGLTYLRNFPDQCVEQTVSRFLPNIMNYRALEAAGLDDPELRAALDEATEFALQKLVSEQKPDGGWGWYLREDSNANTTAYVLIGLVEAREMGYFVDIDVIEDAANFLRGTLDQPATSNWELNRRAFILYALARAGMPDAGRTANLYEDRARLNLDARAFLTMTLHMINPDNRERIDTLIAGFTAEAVTSATGIRFEESYRDRYNWSTNTRSTALVLQALVMVEPQSDLIPQIVRALMADRTRTYWSTTQETAWSVMALTDFMLASGELTPEYSYSVTLNDDALVDGQAVTAENVRDTQQLVVDVSDLLRGEANSLLFSRTDGPGSLYYTAYLNTLLPVPDIQPIDRGITVRRDYVDPDSGEVLEAARIGDVVQVRLTIVVPDTRRYITIEDPLPAGVEAINPRLDTSQRVGTRPSVSRVDNSLGWGWWYFSNIEFRDEKVVLSTSYLPAGVYEYVYTVRPVLEGTYNVIPPTAQEFYFPEIYGRGAGTAFTVLPDEG